MTMIRNTNFISIIICSREKQISKDLIENIKNTVGCDFELIVIDNSENKYSIFEAYNLGIEKSKGEYLCFIHDDVIFHTNDWGNVLECVFNENKEVGLIGVAGSKIKNKMPSAWWDCPAEQKVIHIIQHFPNKEKEKWALGLENGQNKEVVAIDGVFMAMRKDKCINFNTKMSGFHNYDLNISLDYKKHGYKIIVTPKILMEHFSLGTLNKSWYKSTSLFHKLYKNYLPINITGQDIYIQSKKDEFNLGLSFITKLIEQKLYWDAIYWWFEIFKLKPKAKYHYRFWKMILKKYLNLKNG